jgi:hypothetical protein
VRKKDTRKVSRSGLNFINLTILSIKSPFAKGDLGGFKNSCNKSPPAPLYKRGEIWARVNSINFKFAFPIADLNSL